jgi:hypothetical protein
MIKRITIKNIRFTLTIARITKLIGVNSELEDGRHILMWDFDDIPLGKVMDELSIVQARYFLSDVHVLKTKEPDNYIAYCFDSLEWREAVEVIAATPSVDWQFFRFGVYRGHFTLRVSPKGERHICLTARLGGYKLPDVKPSGLKSWVRYETMSWR